MSDSIIELEKVSKIFKGGMSKKGWTVALDKFDLSVERGTAKIQTIAGESGSGKTTLANMVLNFLKPSSGTVYYNGNDIRKAGKKEQLQYRKDVQVVFQDPFAVYNPFFTIDHVFDIMIRNFSITSNKSEAQDLIHDSLRVVGLDPLEVLKKYPHEFSGGQLQRIMIARAFLARPKVIVADEPVSMIDASLRAKLLDVLLGLKESYGISFLYITHDLSTAYHIGDSTMILYKGSLVEHGDTEKVLKEARHPYVQLLLDSIPLPNPDHLWEEDETLQAGKDLEEAEGFALTEGCKFRMRCPHATSICSEAHPPFYSISSDHHVACYLYKDRTPAGVNEARNEEKE